MALIPIPVCKYCGKKIYRAYRKDTCVCRVCSYEKHKEWLRDYYKRKKKELI